MKRKNKGYGTLKRTDHRLDLGPAGRSVFISREKELQQRQARRIRLWMRVVLSLAGVGLCIAGFVVALFYLAPWFREEITVSAPEPEVSQEAEPEPELPVYDDMGLPVYPEEFCLFVINRDSPAQRDQVPELTEISGVSVESRIGPALRQLVAAAKADGLALIFTEGYVSYGEQEKRFNAEVERLMEEERLSAVMARTEAAKTQPRPGQSDFQTGMCLRLEGDPATFADSKTWSWLKQNMGKYGFVFRYPEGGEDYTGLRFDPTVIRYVGGACAAAMQQRGMCLEQYISYLAAQ